MADYTFGQRTGWATITCPQCGQTVKLRYGKCPKCGDSVVDVHASRQTAAPNAPDATLAMSAGAPVPASAPRTQTMVRTYQGKHAQRDLEKDANKLAKDGWSIQSVTDGRKKVGAMRVVALGVFAFTGDKTRLTVVYQRER